VLRPGPRKSPECVLCVDGGYRIGNADAVCVCRVVVQQFIPSNHSYESLGARERSHLLREDAVDTI
jgi:hypothetical protein